MKHSITTQTLESKLRLMFIDIPNTASLNIQIFIGSGYGHAPSSKYELPHLLEHLLFSGNEQIPNGGDFTTKMEAVTANWQGLTNYRNNYFTYNKSMASLPKFFELVGDQLFKPIITQNNLDEQKEVIRQELKRQVDSDMDQCGVVSLQKSLPVLTFEERIATLDSISLTDVITYHKNNFQPDNMSICICGDVKNKTDEIFSSLDKWNGIPANTVTVTYEPKNANQVNVQTSFKAGRSFVQLDMVKFGFNPDDMPALRALQAIWHTSKSSRFYQRIRPQGFSYSPIVSIALTHSYVRLILRDSLPDKNVLGFVAAFMDEFRDLAQKGPTESELTSAKYLLAERDTVNYSSPQQIGDYYAEHWAMGDNPLTIDQFNSAVQSLTVGDIQRVGQEYLSNWSIAIRSGLDEAERPAFDAAITELLSQVTQS